MFVCEDGKEQRKVLEVAHQTASVSGNSLTVNNPLPPPCLFLPLFRLHGNVRPLCIKKLCPSPLTKIMVVVVVVAVNVVNTTYLTNST